MTFWLPINSRFPVFPVRPRIGQRGDWGDPPAAAGDLGMYTAPLSGALAVLGVSTR